MDLFKFCLRKLIAGIPLILGVTFISFLLLVYFGPAPIFAIYGDTTGLTEEQIEHKREELGLDRPFLERYGLYLKELATLDFGDSWKRGQPVGHLLADAIPISLAVVLPGFVLGNLLGLVLALVAARHRGGWIDKAIMGASVFGMSVSFLIVVIAFQIIFCSSYGLDWFPTRGWNMDTFPDYLEHVTVPTLATIFVALGYNTRFYRAVLVEELTRDHVRTARAFGASPTVVLYKHVLKNSLIPIITRIMFSIPLVVVSGSLIIESYFGIPGVGKITYDAIFNADQPIMKAVVGLTAVLFVFVLLINDVLYRVVDPRVSLK